MFSLDGKICLVTGATGLIGLEICRALAEQEAFVVGLYHRSAERLDVLAALPGMARIHAVQCDLRDRAATASVIDAILKQYGRIDVLVCCAGAMLRKSVMFTGDAECTALLDLNVNATVQLCRQVVRPMYRQNGGRIVLIGSRAGEHGLAGQSVYAASKAAMHAFAKSLAFEVGEKNITVNTVAPGAVSGPAQDIYSHEEQAGIRRQIGLRRLAEPHEIAAVVAFLASPAAAYVSGAVVPVDGAARF